MNKIITHFKTPRPGKIIEENSSGIGAPRLILHKVNAEKEFYQVYTKTPTRTNKYQSHVEAEGSYDYCLGYFHAKTQK